MIKNISSEGQLSLHKALLELTEIADSFDQLGKLAVIGDLLYLPAEQGHKELFKAVETTARRLRGLPIIGQEVKKDDIPPTFYFGNFSNKG